LNTCKVRNGDYIEKWSHCAPFVFNKLWDKKYLRFSFDSLMYDQSTCCVEIHIDDPQYFPLHIELTLTAKCWIRFCT
jgi:hypothetical protein